MCYADNEKQKTLNDERNKTMIYRKNQNTWRKGNYKYLGILEADTIKHAEIKEKKNTPGERENYSKPNYIVEISSKV